MLRPFLYLLLSILGLVQSHPLSMEASTKSWSKHNLRRRLAPKPIVRPPAKSSTAHNQAKGTGSKSSAHNNDNAHPAPAGRRESSAQFDRSSSESETIPLFDSFALDTRYDRVYSEFKARPLKWKGQAKDDFLLANMEFNSLRYKISGLDLEFVSRMANNENLLEGKSMIPSRLDLKNYRERRNKLFKEQEKALDKMENLMTKYGSTDLIREAAAVEEVGMRVAADIDRLTESVVTRYKKIVDDDFAQHLLEAIYQEDPKGYSMFFGEKTGGRRTKAYNKKILEERRALINEQIEDVEELQTLSLLLGEGLKRTSESAYQKLEPLPIKLDKYRELLTMFRDLLESQPPPK